MTNSCGAKGVPANFPPCSISGKTFDIKIYSAYGLITYGGPKSVSGNQFRIGWQTNPNDPNSINRSKGNFVDYDAEQNRNGNGEYRYLGYTYEGKLQSNEIFINDASTPNPPGPKRWIYHPWDTIKSIISYPMNNQVAGIFSNSGEIDQPESHRINQLVTTSLGFNFPNAINYPAETKIAGKLPLHYMYLQQQPSLLSDGAGVMWHLTSNDNIYQQTFRVDRIEDKEPATLKVQSKAEAITPCYDGKGTSVPITLNVNANLDDSSLDPIERMSYYNSGDLSGWTFKVLGQTVTAPVNANMGKATIRVNIPISAINQATKQYEGSVEVTANYFRGKKQLSSAPFIASFSTKCGDGIKSLFEVQKSISFTQFADFADSSINYGDLSKGKTINQYNLKITELSGGSHQTFTYYRSEGHINDDEVQTNLFAFMQPFFSQAGDTNPSGDSHSFKIDQTVKSPYETDTYSQTVNVSHKGKVPPQPVEPNADLPLEWFDIVQFPAKDYTDMSKIAERTVRIDGQVVDADTFFNGNYVFGEDGVGWHYIQIDYVTDDGAPSLNYRWTYIHNTKPNAFYTLDGPFKENRKMSAANQSDTPDANDQFVTKTYPMSYEWEFGALDTSSNSDLHIKTDTDLHQAFQYSKPGRYYLQLTSSNSLGRVSDPYRIEFEIMPDQKPAIILHPYDSAAVRGGVIGLDYEVDSIDGDYISDKYIDVYYDKNNDGTAETFIEKLTGDIASYRVPADKLGNYELRAYAIEGTNQEYYPEFTGGDFHKDNKQTEYFVVDNLQPFADLYMDEPLKRPKVDAFLLLDGNLAQSRTDYVNGNKVNLNNDLRDYALDPVVENWDMKTYTYSSPATTSEVSGSSYPPSSTSYSSNGYSGTLSLSSASNAPYPQDDGKFESKQESKTFTDTCSNHKTKPKGGSWSDDNLCPATQSVNKDGYSGSIGKSGFYKTGEGCESNGDCWQDWTANYSGTLNKTVQVWVPDINWYDKWTGFYSGTIYKNVRQPYKNSFFRVDSDKYVVYVSDGNVKDAGDLQHVMRTNQGGLILVGPEALRTHVTNLGIPIESFILNNKGIDQLMGEVTNYIGEKNHTASSVLRELGDTVNLYTAEVDDEQDPMRNEVMQLVHDSGYFENTMGQDSSAAATYTPAGYTSATITSKTFNKVGRYDFYRKLEDQPSSDSKFAKYNYESNEAKLGVVVHRIPIALAELDWTYNANGNFYHTSWVDKSYDLDHQFLHATKGIVDRKIKLTETGSGQVYTAIPSELTYGTYHLEYVVRDVEGAWSVPFLLDFTLSSSPPPQLKAKLRAVDPYFKLTGVPASEKIEAYDLWTRYPYSLTLRHQMSSHINKLIPYFTGVKSGSDISWDPVTSNIPSTAPDGTYNYRITAEGSAGTTAYENFTVTVRTPIQLTGQVDRGASANVSELVAGEPITIKGLTTEYPHEVSVVMFRGTPYQKSVNLTGQVTATAGVGEQDWGVGAIVSAVPDGSYVFEWTARTPNGNVEKATRTYQVVNNRPPAGDFDWLPKPVYEGDTLTLSHTITDPDRDKLTTAYEITDPSGHISHSSFSSSYPYTSAGPILPKVSPGNYRVIMTITDGRASATSTHVITVLPLTLEAGVDHTADWLKIHTKLGHETANHPKDFYSGEIMIVKARTAAAPVKEVTVTLDAAGMDGKKILTSATLDLTSIARMYSKELFDSRWTSLTQGMKRGTYRLQFAVEYKNGVTKEADVPIHIIGNIYEAAGVHRQQ
ncbi:Athe_2463 domain-containing protein [Paenibacillus sp. GCM10023252]|uniref:Athe_2463 domain-containing protein n=1 Tax=Paenibacillus sp. GCM10023252 TaxID=3252649 RepID=UPI00361901A5